jgi:predicted membrane-bound spermidine synthase
VSTSVQDRPGVALAAPRWPGLAFAGTILLSAFLLFQVQPLISKFILPWFGGCPAVWTTCMLFFQVMLFAGYSYAHLVGSRLTLRGQAIVQLGILLAAAVLLPIAPAVSWKPVGSAAPAGRILLLLLVTVGLPYFVLSTTSPLVQVWFSRTYPGRSPYRLYALSNLGSLAALLSYPFFFEPAFDLPRQSWLWSAGFVGYVLLCAGCTTWLWRLSPPAPLARPAVPETRLDKPTAAPQGGDCPQDDCPRVGLLRRALWLLLPACGSLMLLATTNHVCQDVAVVPFLWVVPLALYLLSFIICFDHPRWYVRGLWTVLAAGAILLAADPDTIVGKLAPVLHQWNERIPKDFSLNYIEELVLYFSAMFLICMVCHGELMRLRPHPRRLTEYYLMMSAGGALGGVLVSLVAPLVFKTFFEWQLGLVLSFIVAGAAMTLAAVSGAARLGAKLLRAAPVAIAAGAGFGLLLAMLILPTLGEHEDWVTVDQARNFYGVLSVRDWHPGQPENQRILRHGIIKHGEQYVDPSKRQIPKSYYCYESGVGRCLQYLNQRKPALRVGVVGLGAGTIAAYARKGDTYRFYEINPEVERFAGTQGRYFTYLRDALERGAKVDVKMGDARLSLEREPDKGLGKVEFDLLALDAFSGDAIPAHLLTREAFAIYRRHLAAGGVIAVHITNSYLYLAPVVRGIAKDAGLGMTRIFISRDRQLDRDRSDWVLLTEDAGLLSALPVELPADARGTDDFDVGLWTDHYNNLFSILKTAH